jgi:hypothetical protein
LLVDEAMRLERSQVLQAQPYERTPRPSDGTLIARCGRYGSAPRCMPVPSTASTSR